MANVTQPLGENIVVDLLIVVPAVLGLIYSAFQWRAVSSVVLDGHPQVLDLPTSRGKRKEDILSKLVELAQIISDGAMAFLIAEYKVMAIYVVLFSVLLYFVTNAVCMISFVVGSITSVVAGLIGMKIAVFTNCRVAHQCWKSLAAGYAVAIQGGSVMGLSLVAVGVLALYVLIKVFEAFSLNSFTDATQGTEWEQLYEAIAGYGLGGSSIALFGRVGGGIYTKAADVGADLSGKNDYGLEEDDYRNPGCIADNVGDNVGDIAGMGADLFGSFAESTCAAMVLVVSDEHLRVSFAARMYPMLITSVGIIVGMLTLLVVGFVFPVSSFHAVEKALKGILIISTILMSPVAVALSYYCLTTKDGADISSTICWWHCAIAVNLGLWSGLIIGFVTEYYTSSTYKPVREIAETQKQSAATGIIYGLALGYLSCIIPVLCLGVTILVSHKLCGMFGVALGALGMLGTMTMALTIDAYGPISDNAGGLAEMSEMPDEVRTRTDCLDAAGNTTAAIGKGFAIGSAALVSLALFGAFCVRAFPKKTDGTFPSVDIKDPWVFTGLLFGAMIPYAFAALTMKSVGVAANDMVVECMRQFPAIINDGATPDYQRCIEISTNASLREMIAPGLLVILSPIVAGCGFGKNACAGMLTGALVSSVQLAISMSNSGGAWDNAKKYISSGGLGAEFVKGSPAHANSVTGDTVGDPLKDTSGPALNIVMKLTAIISLVFGAAIKNCSSPSGGPKWLTQ